MAESKFKPALKKNKKTPPSKKTKKNKNKKKTPTYSEKLLLSFLFSTAEGIKIT